MKKYAMIAMAAAAMLAPAMAQAQKFGSSYRAPAPTYRAPAPVYHAPAPTYRAPATSTYRPAAAVPTRATVTVPRAAPRVQTTRTTTVTRTTARAATTPRNVAMPSTVRTTTRTTTRGRDQTTGAPRRASYRTGGRNYAWSSPYAMPIWWMAATHQPYSYDSYDAYIRRCLETPRDRRSRECVRALRERGYD